MTETLERLTSARLVDLLDELLTAEARMAALGQLGADIRAELNRRGAEIYERDGMAPTWRADDKLGSISYSVGKDAVQVVDRDDFLSWAAQQHPGEVTATLEVPAAALPWLLEILRWATEPMGRESKHEKLNLVPFDEVPECLAGWQPRPELVAREAWQKVFLEKHTTVIEPEQICNAKGEVVPGLAQRRTGRVGVSVRVNPEAKDRAIAELGDPMAFAVLTAPIGQVAAAHADGGEPPLVDAADGEPEYDDRHELPPVPLHPVGAAEHAIVVQGGFSTPAIEAFRILRDAMRIARSGGVLDERWQKGVLDTLDWLDDQADAEVDGEEARFAADHPGDWREELFAAVHTSSILEQLGDTVLEAANAVDLRRWCQELKLHTGGSKVELRKRLIRRRDQQMAGAGR